jgi:hypothetical protein
MALSQARLKSLVEYDPELGLFKWLAYGPNRKTGWFEGSKMTRGYLCLRIDGVTHYCHKLAWLYVHGETPEIVDHKNRVNNDNRICNLRAANHSINMINTKTRVDNSSGYRGISWNKATEQWYAYVNIDGRRYAKYYDDLETAIAFREAMAAKHHGVFRAAELPDALPASSEIF